MMSTMRTVQTTYDGLQHCTAVVNPLDKSVALDCPHTGKGEEISSTNMVEAAVAGCMLMSMGILAMQSNLDITGTRTDVKIASSDKPPYRFSSIDVVVTMAKNFSQRDRVKLETGANACPIKHSFGADIPITVQYNYPE
ncbi:OsmC family protein [Candidatus Omnitrophota bacterium]